MVYTKKEVQQWLSNRSIDPKTFKKIPKYGKKYFDLENRAKKLKLIIPYNKTVLSKYYRPSNLQIFKPTVQECKEWLKNKTVNPRSGRVIGYNKYVYKKYYNQCILYGLMERLKPKTPILIPMKNKVSSKKKKFKPEFTKKQCKEWLKNRNINPKSGRKISKNGSVYQKFKKCIKYYNL